MRKWD